MAWWGDRFLDEHAAPVAESTPPGTFRATEQQLKSLSIEPVVLHGFADEQFTEGRIAVNGDCTTAVFSAYSGRVTRVIAGLGDAVKAGAPLAMVEASEFVQAQSDLRTAAAQVKIARIVETRKHALYDVKGGSLQDWQQAEADLTAAETALGSIRSRLKILGKSDSDIDQLQSSHAMNAAAAITAPINGIVVERQLGLGQYLQAGGGTPIFTIADPTSVWLLANVREADAGLVRLAQTVEVHVLAYPGRAFTARLTYIGAVIDPVTHRLTVRAEVDNHDAALKPEMLASFRILTSGVANSAAVPEAAVVYEGALAHVWVLGPGSLLEYRSIRIGRNHDGWAEVLDGVKPGERIVTKGALFIDQAAVPAST